MSELAPHDQQQLLDLVEEQQRNRAFELSGKLADIPHILLPYQKRWHADKAAVRIQEKSRRIGGTWGCLAAEAALEASLSRKAGGMDQLYVGYNKEMAAEFIGDCAFFAKAYSLTASTISVSLEKAVIDKEDRDIVKYSITFASGYQCIALSSRPAAFRGRQGHARIDEAAFHDDLQALVDAAMAFLIWGGRVDIVSTHFGEENVFNQIVQDVKRGKFKYSLHTTTFDQAIAEGFYKRICLVRGKEWTADGEKEFRDTIYAQYGAAADQELGCMPLSGSGAYFTRTLYEQCMDPAATIIRWAKPAEWVTDSNRIAQAETWFTDTVKPVIDNMDMTKRTVYGQDFGRDGDLSVIWILQADGVKRWRTAFTIELRKIPFDVQRLIRKRVIDNLPLFHHAKFDARGNGQSHAEAAKQDHGEQRVECVMLSQSWYALHFPKYRQAFEDRSIKVPKSEDMIADHRRIVLEKGIPKMSDGRDRGSDGFYRHGDSAVAGVLAWAAGLEETEPAAGANVDDEDDVRLPSAMQGRPRATMFRSI